MIKNILKFFDKLEDKIRRKLSHHPFVYALIGGTGVVLFWRGIWHLADDISLTSTLSLIIGTMILLVTGIFVSEFIGKQIIISGLAEEQKIEKKEESEIETEENQLKKMQSTLSSLEKKIDHMETHLEPIPEEERRD